VTSEVGAKRASDQSGEIWPGGIQYHYITYQRSRRLYRFKWGGKVVAAKRSLENLLVEVQRITGARVQDLVRDRIVLGTVATASPLPAGIIAQGDLAKWLGITPLSVRLGCMMQLPLRKRAEKMPGMSMESWCRVLHVPFKGQRKVALQAKLAAALHADATVFAAEGGPAAVARAPEAASTVAILSSPQQGDGPCRQISLR
jgi:hypothetical protein